MLENVWAHIVQEVMQHWRWFWSLNQCILVMIKCQFGGVSSLPSSCCHDAVKICAPWAAMSNACCEISPCRERSAIAPRYSEWWWAGKYRSDNHSPSLLLRSYHLYKNTALSFSLSFQTLCFFSPLFTSLPLPNMCLVVQSHPSCKPTGRIQARCWCTICILWGQSVGQQVQVSSVTRPSAYLQLDTPSDRLKVREDVVYMDNNGLFIFLPVLPTHDPW